MPVFSHILWHGCMNTPLAGGFRATADRFAQILADAGGQVHWSVILLLAHESLCAINPTRLIGKDVAKPMSKIGKIEAGQAN